MKCARCGLESAHEKFFHTVRRTFSRRTRSLCPTCFRDKDDAVHKITFWSFCVLGLVGLFRIFVFPNLAMVTVPLNLGFLTVASVVGTILHELGHAAAGMLAGHRIFSVEIGKGAAFLEFKWLGSRWRFGALPVGGLVMGMPRRPDCPRLRRALFIAGGPAANAILALIAWKLLWLDKLLAFGPLAGFTPVGMILFANLMIVVVGLWPYRVLTAHGRVSSDGLSLWQIWREDNAKFPASFYLFYLLEANECCLDRKFVDAQKWLADGLRAFPGNHWLEFNAAAVLVSESKLEPARDAFRALLPALENDPNLYPLLLNNIAWLDVMLGRPELLPEADDFSRRALESGPGMPCIRGTRGSVLVELGQYNEGVALLEDALRREPGKPGKAISACYLGIAAARRGQAAECRNYFALARKLDPHCLLLSGEKNPAGETSAPEPAPMPVRTEN